MGTSRKLGIIGHRRLSRSSSRYFLFAVAGCGEHQHHYHGAARPPRPAVRQPHGQADHRRPPRHGRLCHDGRFDRAHEDGQTAHRGQHAAVRTGQRRGTGRDQRLEGSRRQGERRRRHHVGDTNYQIDFKVEDSKGTTDGATTAATKLALQDNAKFILGDISDNMAQAIYAVSGKAGALYFNTLPVNGNDVPGAIGQPGADKPLQLDFRRRPSPMRTSSPRKYLVENYPNAKKVAVAAISFSDYDSYKEVYQQKWGPLGLTIVSYERFDPPTTDMVPVTTKLLASKPDAICVSRAAIPHLIGIVKAAREQGFTGPIFYCTPTDISLVAPGRTERHRRVRHRPGPGRPESSARPARRPSPTSRPSTARTSPPTAWWAMARSCCWPR